MTKKILSVVLCIVMVLSIFTIVPLEFSAQEIDVANQGTSKTAVEAISWASSKIGQSLDYDGAYGAQCVDLIAYYYQFLGAPVPGGNACDYSWNALPAGWTRTAGGTPQKGDILVYTGGYGHVAIYESDNVSYHQNWRGQYVSREERYYANSVWSGAEGVTKTYWGCIHPNFSGNAVDLGTNFCAFIINTAMWKHLTVESDCNVVIRSEKSSYCADQVWRFERQADGSYKIISTANGMVLDVHNSSSIDFANVKVHENNNSDAQRWYIYGSSGQFILKAKCTGCVLDVNGNSSAEGTNIQMYSQNNSSAQKFQIYGIDNKQFATNVGTSFTAPILNKKSWITLENEVSGNISLQKETGKSNQLWLFNRQTDGSYIINSCYDGKCIDLDNASHENGTNIKMCVYNGTDAQKWYIYERAGGYAIQSKESGNFFDIEDGKLVFGSNLQAYTYNETDAQIFSIYIGEECKLRATNLKVSTNSNKALFSWDSVFGTDDYTIKIWNSNTSENNPYKVIEYIPKSSQSLEISLTKGDYEGYIITKNFYETYNSNRITFSIDEIIGDADKDGAVTIMDATIIQKWLAKLLSDDDIDLSVADTEGNGDVSITDCTMIQRFLAGLSCPENIGKPIS